MKKLERCVVGEIREANFKHYSIRLRILKSDELLNTADARICRNELFAAEEELVQHDAECKQCTEATK